MSAQTPDPAQPPPLRPSASSASSAVKSSCIPARQAPRPATTQAHPSTIAWPLATTIALALSACSAPSERVGPSPGGPDASPPPQTTSSTQATSSAQPTSPGPPNALTDATASNALATTPEPADDPATTPPSALASAPPPAPTPGDAEAAAGFDPEAASLVLEPAWSGFDDPVYLTGAGDGSGRRFVVEQPGRIRLIAGSDIRPAPYLDLTDRVGSRASEQGLLGLAFHPRFAENGRLFVHYTDRAGDTVVSELRAAPDAETVDPGTERVLLRQGQPAANHNGGQLAFGPDGMLHIGLGDGGGANDVYENGQRPGTLLAKILRVDVDAEAGGAPYAVPADNPLLGTDFAPETWAWGLRNPWRFSFDRATGDLYIGDVGQNAWEEIDVEPAGSPGGLNYGWPMLEGARCLRGGGPPESCGATAELVMPAAVYGHDLGCSVTGGYVYRGPDAPILEGVYLYGDYCSGRLWGLWRDAAGTWRDALLADTDLAISSFGEDDDGAVFVLDHGGDVLRVLARPR